MKNGFYKQPVADWARGCKGNRPQACYDFGLKAMYTWPLNRM